MPELPEVETVRRGLQRLLPGRRVLAVESLNEKSFPNSVNDTEAFFLGAKISQVRRRAKVLIIDLSTNYSLVIHLKMTGQIVFRGDENFAAGHPNDSFLGKLPDRSTRVEFDLDNGAKLFFNDQRKFGWVKLIPTNLVDDMDFMKKVGPEPLTGDPFPEYLLRIRRRNGTTIKAAILDQSVVAGIGNIYADEALWAAKIHPTTRVRDLSDDELRNILTAAISVMNLSLEKGGSTDKNYVDAEGKKGSYLTFANVFRRENQPCPRCGTIIEKIRVAGRGTHICPHCQIMKGEK